MKHIPNILTLANLMFGCIAITYILNAPSFITTTTGEDFRPVLGLEQMYWGSIFIFLAALMDVLDGLAARVLNAHSPIGKDLDSLADVVSFGVAPGMILYKLLWMAYMQEPGALDTPLLTMAPAFLIACFGALRLARFNQTASSNAGYFKGMPIPASGIIVASFPLMLWYPNSIFAVDEILTNKWFLYAVIALLSYLMVSKINFLKWKAPGKGIGAWWPQIIIAIVVVFGSPFLNFSIVPIAFLVYIVCSLIYKYPTEVQ